MRDVTIVVPCYNEAARLPVAEFLRYADAHMRIGFLFVDDGSQDDTWNVLRELAAGRESTFECMRLPSNRGKAEAVRLGTLHAFESDVAYVGFWDADLSTPLGMIGEFCSVLDRDSRLEAVIGSRVKLLGRRIHRLESRHYLGRAFATAASFVLGMPVYDTQCGAKLFRNTGLVQSLFQQGFRSRWVFDVEILARMAHGTRLRNLPDVEELIYELPLMEWQDVRGSKLRPRDFLRSAVDLGRIYWAYFGPAASTSPGVPKPGQPPVLTLTEHSTGAHDTTEAPH